MARSSPFPLLHGEMALSCSLFVGLALTAWWTSVYYRDDEDDGPFSPSSRTSNANNHPLSSLDDIDDRLFLEWYTQRRLQDRLSFHLLDEDDESEKDNNNVNHSDNNDEVYHNNKRNNRDNNQRRTLKQRSTPERNRSDRSLSPASSLVSFSSGVSDDEDEPRYRRRSHRRSKKKNRPLVRPTRSTNVSWSATIGNVDPDSSSSSVDDSSALRGDATNNNNWSHFEHYSETGKRRSQYLMKQHSTFMSLGGDRRPTPYDHPEEVSVHDDDDDDEEEEDDDSWPSDHIPSHNSSSHGTPRFTMPSIPSERVLIMPEYFSHPSTPLHLAPTTPPRHTAPPSLLQHLKEEKTAALLLRKSKSYDQLSVPAKMKHKLSKTVARWKGSHRHSFSMPAAAAAPVIPPLDMCERHRVARTSYNSRIMPHQVILIRHGQSMGNVDEHLYSTTPDNAMPLTRLGWDQARQAGRMLKDQLLTKKTKCPPVHFIVSPYVRTVETMHGTYTMNCHK
jgi:hypothetical protein